MRFETQARELEPQKDLKVFEYFLKLELLKCLHYALNNFVCRHLREKSEKRDFKTVF